jgi:glycosyltransferase involved in cell wall biosynthesis
MIYHKDGSQKSEPKMPLESCPHISIVMGTYNGERYLREQLESIYKQSYSNIDVVVCDDCSTDATVEILKEFSKRHGLIYFVNEMNLGLVKNFEKALSLAKGDYIALADQDDIWYPEKIELLLNNIENFSLIHSSVNVIDADGKPHPNAFVVSEYSRDHSEKVNFSDFLDTAWVLGCTSLIDKSLLEKCLPFPEGVMFHDWWLTMAAIKLGRGIKYIHQPTIKYRQYGENTAFKFFLDISWHKKRFEFYKLLDTRFCDILTQDEKTKLTTIAYQNAALFIMTGIQRGQEALVEQFLVENKDLLTIPFIKELLTIFKSNMNEDPASFKESVLVDQYASDPAYKLIVTLRNKIYRPLSIQDKIFSIFFRRVFRPIIYVPLRKMYQLFRARPGK